MLATIHNHSHWSDGRSSPEQMYQAAAALGVGRFGLSDHLCVYGDGRTPEWSVRPDRVPDYVRSVRALEQAGGPQVAVGLEFDWFEVPHPTLAGIIAAADLDFRIGAIHHLGGEQFDADPGYWAHRSAAEREECYRRYWTLVAAMAASRLFDVAAHLDLLKKFGFGPGPGATKERETALDALRDHGLMVELNTAGFLKPCRDGYPSVEMLRGCHRRGIPVTLSSDAHILDHLCLEFERGAANLAAAGYTEIGRIERREIWFEPLALSFRR